MRAPYKEQEYCWHPPDLEWLFHQHLVLCKPLKSIAQEIDVDKYTVSRWARELDIYANLTEPVKVGQGSGSRVYGMTREWLEREYVELGKSANTIANEIGTTPYSVMSWLRKRGIQVRTRDELNERHSDRMSGAGNPAWNGGTSRNYHARLVADREQVCEWCSTTDDIQVHHRDHNTSNGNPDNLGLLCESCNQIEAWFWKLEQSGRAKVTIDNQTGSIEWLWR